MRVINLVIVCFCLIIQFSCLKRNNAITVGFLVHTLEDERWTVERDIFTKRINELGGKVLFENANLDERVQYHLAEEMVESGINVLVVVPVNSKTAASISRLCEKNKVKLIAYDIMIENSKPDLFISFDNILIGEMMATYAIENHPTGNYVLLWGDGGMNVAQWVKEGQLNILNDFIESKKINVVYKSYVENWSKDEAFHLTEEVLDNIGCTIDVVIASSDGIADGVIESIRGHNLEQYPLITGQDASQKAMQNIRVGLQSMTIYKPFDKMATMAANAAFDMACGKKIKADTVLFNERADIPSILLKPSIINEKNVGQIMVAKN